MTDSRFNIVVTAVDKATAVVRKVNQSFSTLTRPVAQMKSVVTAFSKEAGLDKIAKSFKDMGQAAGDAAGKIVGVATPLGFITSAGSVAGMTMLAIEWARFGAEVGRTAPTLNMTVEQLQLMRGAASLAGVPVDSLTNGLKTLGNTMEDALYGRNQEALVILNKLGISIHRTATGAVDTKRAFMDLANAISGIKNAQVQSLVARTFGLEDALPLLRRGADGVAELEKRVQATGYVMGGPATAAAQKFWESMAALGLALGGVKNAIGEDLSAFAPLLDFMARMISEHRHAIALVAELISGLITFRIVAVVAARAIGVLAAVMSSALIPAVTRLMLGLAVFTDGLASMLAGIPLVSSVLEGLSAAFLAIGAAIEATPVGWILTALAAIALAAYEIYKHWDAILAKIKAVGHVLGSVARVATFGLWNPNSADGSKAVSSGSAGAAVVGASPEVALAAPVATPYRPLTAAQSVAGQPSAMTAAQRMLGLPSNAQNSNGPGAPSGSNDGPQLGVTVTFENAPRGMKARVTSNRDVDPGIFINYAMPSGVTP